MTTTTLGVITPGEWTVEHKDGYFPSVRIPTSTGGTDKLTINAGFWESKVHLANAKLIADAGNTANKTGKLPSQLKQDVDELVGALRNLLSGRCTGELFDGNLYFRDNDDSRLRIVQARAILSKYPKP